ncbi:MAG TPA: valine--tRNA ligase [Gammaproteobacteria bacterium]|nr:valine--tRNA ligase [Gammaproteobacteria bacterium]
MEKTYNPKEIETRIYASWEDSGYFSPSKSGDPFCIVIPPPNVTGTLHMGHAFQDTIMDIIIRYERMKGKNTLWQVGTDHAGIATQMVVERQLEKNGTSRQQLGRETFEQEVWKWKEESGSTITKQMKRLGASTDWTKEKFTMDENLVRGVTKVFIQLYEEGLIYRGKRLVNWDPVLQTALSDLEVATSEEKGSLWHMRYPLDGQEDYIVVATTRPETMLGDTAVAVHPDDKRYKHLVGKHIILPLTKRKIPIIADEYVDQAFGTGCVKITPAHDFNDFEIGKKHGLEVISVLDQAAKISQSAPSEYGGLDRFEARRKIVKDLEELGLMHEIEDYLLTIPRGDRSGAILEPLITNQWFLKMEPLAKPAIEVVKNGELKFVPENWSKTYFEWLENIQDWCISRQLWWGHRIPAWYDNEGNVFVGENEPEIRKKHNLDGSIVLTQDQDVLDTWFSSALWPFSSLGWPDDTYDLKTFYPTNVLVTGFDIIFFWVARMVMMGLKFMDEIPFNEIYIHGLIKDKNGQKMSKSKGNILDPIDLIDGISLDDLLEKRVQGLMQPEMEQRIINDTKKEFPNGIPDFGTDALRFNFAIQASTGRDIRLDLNRVEGYRNFCNKIWNASRFIKMNTNDFELLNIKDSQGHAIDQWIQSRYAKTIDEVEKQFGQYRFDLAATAMYEFVWNDFCDWYIELAKTHINDPGIADSKKDYTKNNLINMLDAILRMLHPTIPFITEEIWQSLNEENAKRSIMKSVFPSSDDWKTDDESAENTEWLKNFISSVRQIRSEMNIPPKQSISIIVEDASSLDCERLESLGSFIRNLGSVEAIMHKESSDVLPKSAIALLGEMKVFIPLEGLVDIEEEKGRLEKKLSKLNKELESVQNRLSNDAFIEKAPSDVVDDLKAKLKGLISDQSRIEEQIKLL